MDKQFIYTDGEKAVSLTGEEGWTYFSKPANTSEIEQYARVAAAFRMYNLFADTVSSVPFSILDRKSKEEFQRKHSYSW